MAELDNKKEKLPTTLKKVPIRCPYDDLVALDDLVIFQGELKAINPKNKRKLKDSIIENGIILPLILLALPAKTKKQKENAVTIIDREGKEVKAWRTKEILDGTQRTKVSPELISEGYDVREWPVIWMYAPTRKKAAEILMEYVSQFGEVTKDGLAAFMETYSMTFDKLQTSFQIPGLDLAAFGKKQKAEELAGNSAPEYPIVARFQESYNGAVIFTENEMDWESLKSIIGLTKRQSYKSKSVGITRIIKFETFFENIKKWAAANRDVSNTELEELRKQLDAQFLKNEELTVENAKLKKQIEELNPARDGNAKSEE